LLLADGIQLQFNPRLSTNLKELENDIKNIQGKFKLDLKLNLDKSELQNLPKLKFDIDLKNISAQMDSAFKNINPVISNPLANKIAESFGIKKVQDIQKITQAVQEYQRILKQGNEENLSKTFDNIKNSVVDSLRNIKKEITDTQKYYSDFLSYLRNSKIYIPATDRGDSYNDNRLSIGSKVIVSKQNARSEIDSWYQEASQLFPTILPADVINAEDMFNRLAEAAKKSRAIIRNNKLTPDDFGGESVISDVITGIINEFDTGAAAIEKSVSKINSAISGLGTKVDLSKFGLNSDDLKNIPIEQIETLFNVMNKMNDKFANSNWISTDLFQKAGNDIARFNYEVINSDGNLEKWNRSFNISTGEIYETTKQIKNSRR